jgi:hypothetical protein
MQARPEALARRQSPALVPTPDRPSGGAELESLHNLIFATMGDIHDGFDTILILDFGSQVRVVRVVFVVSHLWCSIVILLLADVVN